MNLHNMLLVIKQDLLQATPLVLVNVLSPEQFPVREHLIQKILLNRNSRMDRCSTFLESHTLNIQTL